MTSMGEVFNNQTTNAAKEETQASRVQKQLIQQDREIARLQVLLHTAQKQIERINIQMPAIIEYLESQADVVDGDNGIPHPNKAMTLLVWLRHEMEGKD
jgi:predicted RecB family endonuclease